MSTTQVTSSPRGPRAKHQQFRGATQAPANNNGSSGKTSQRRPRGNRNNNASNGAAQHQRAAAGTSTTACTTDSSDPGFADTAVLSSEDVPMPTGPRVPKKHTQSQPSDRVFSPTAAANASLTDTEAGPGNPSATPAKAQGAYAGPTFHASPAASALPIPKFLSRSVPAKTRAGPSTPPDEGSDSAGSPTPSSPSPSRAPIPVPPRCRDSPLDLLFKADRAEKARNFNLSPASAAFSNSPSQHAEDNPHRVSHDSQSPHNALFPIELDAEGQNRSSKSPSHVGSAPPVALRSVTAPSKIPHTEGASIPNNDSAAIQDLFNRLSMSQQRATATTPPRAEGRKPSEPPSRHQSPSPFYDGRSAVRSASGPTTPVPHNQEPSDFFYGNKNLSPLFKAAAKPEMRKRNSGLRTEITADSPIMPQGEFPPIPAGPKMNADVVSRNYLHQTMGGPVNSRRGSVPHVSPYRETPNNRKPRTPGKTPYRSRPDSYPHGNNGVANGATMSPPKSNPFVPSSVQAKQYSAVAKSPDSQSLEQDLKRLLNIKMGNIAGVR